MGSSSYLGEMKFMKGFEANNKNVPLKMILKASRR